MSNLDMQTRRYLEQMMIRFTSLGVPVDQGAQELVEIEAHIAASGSDPFEELGDPQELASSVIPQEQRLELYQRNLRHDIFTGVLFAAVFCLGLQLVLSYFGSAETSVPRMLLFFVLTSLFSAGQFAFSSIAMGVSDDDGGSLRLRGAARVCLWAFWAVLAFAGALALAGADFTGDEPFVQSTAVWAMLLVLAVAVSALVAWRGWRLQGQATALIEGGVTGQILHEMNHNGFGKGWVRYGPDGTDLRDPNYSLSRDLRMQFGMLKSAASGAVAADKDEG